MKAKRKKSEHAFVDKVYNYDLTKPLKYWSNVAVVGVHGRLYSQSPGKIPTTKCRCLLRNIVIQHTCLMDCISLFTF